LGFGGIAVVPVEVAAVEVAGVVAALVAFVPLTLLADLAPIPALLLPDLPPTRQNGRAEVGVETGGLGVAAVEPVGTQMVGAGATHAVHVTPGINPAALAAFPVTVGPVAVTVLPVIVLPVEVTALPALATATPAGQVGYKVVDVTVDPVMVLPVIALAALVAPVPTALADLLAQIPLILATVGHDLADLAMT